MAGCKLDEKLIGGSMAFHGHWCPGLAIGIRAAELALREIGSSMDEEVVAVAETNMCGVDALQYLTGCTLGKGNLIVENYGKVAFSFYRRCDGKSLRIVLRPGASGKDKSREERASFIMNAELEDLFEIKPVQRPMPGRARIEESLTCEECGEKVMESRTGKLHGRILCIPCLEKLS